MRPQLGPFIAVTALAIAGAAVPAIARAAGSPRGVYGCYEARAAMNVPGCVRSSLGCMGVRITIAPVVMFGLIDGTTYSDYDGHRGHYRYDNGSGILTMLDGSRRGWRYKRVGNWSFRMLDQAGKETPYTCPLEPGKDPLRRPW